MGYDRGDSFPFDFEPNGIPFVLKSEENCHHDYIPFNVKENAKYLGFSVQRIGFQILYDQEGVCVPLICTLSEYGNRKIPFRKTPPQIEQIIPFSGNSLSPRGLKFSPRKTPPGLKIPSSLNIKTTHDKNKIVT